MFNEAKQKAEQQQKIFFDQNLWYTLGIYGKFSDKTKEKGVNDNNMICYTKIANYIVHNQHKKGKKDSDPRRYYHSKFSIHEINTEQKIPTEKNWIEKKWNE